MTSASDPKPTFARCWAVVFMARDFWNDNLRSDASTANRNLSGVELAMASVTRAFCRAPKLHATTFLVLAPTAAGA